VSNTREQTNKGAVMSKNSNQVLACGACAVMVGENGTKETSVDVLAGAVKRLFSKKHNAKRF